eukprot:1153856-Pelagomonas_calceolata.AAC.2
MPPAVTLLLGAVSIGSAAQNRAAGQHARLLRWHAQLALFRSVQHFAPVGGTAPAWQRAGLSRVPALPMYTSANMDEDFF